MGRSGPPPPIDARWSKSQTWANPDWSAIRQTARRSAMVVSWPEFLSPKRSGCFIWFTSVKESWLDAYGEVVLVGEDFWRPVETLDLLSILADERRHLVRRGLLR